MYDIWSGTIYLTIYLTIYHSKKWYIMRYLVIVVGFGRNIRRSSLRFLGWNFSHGLLCPESFKISTFWRLGGGGMSHFETWSKKGVKNDLKYGKTHVLGCFPGYYERTWTERTERLPSSSGPEKNLRGRREQKLQNSAFWTLVGGGGGATVQNETPPRGPKCSFSKFKCSWRI